MAYSQCHYVLSAFDIADEEHDYLSSIIDSSTISAEDRRHLLQVSLLTGAEDWQYTIDCARALRDRTQPNPRSLEPQDVLSYIPSVLRRPLPETPWTRTDRLISLAKQLGERARLDTIHLQPDTQTPVPRQPLQPVRRAKPKCTSHYWGPTGEDSSTKLSALGKQLSKTCMRTTEISRLGPHEAVFRPGCQVVSPSETVPPSLPAPQTWLPPSTRTGISPYFHGAQSPSKQRSPRRPAPGVVSSVPFPPLYAPMFGLVQERQAHEPFWLLIAVTFLIKTRGTVAVPVFEKVKARFPSPSDIANPANAEAILDMIRPLGLAKNRLAFLQKYGRGFLTSPPTSERRYRVPGYDHREPGYDHREPDSPRDDALPGATSDDGMLTSSREDADETDAWEIGHLTKGKYALDSWRIFCRDELLGRAGDWNGLGREGEFQPEWMRVRPDDKELRAYLRWLWMRDGWEWNPRTGERTVLREELRRAVNERRVEYDDHGELRILDEPRNKKRREQRVLQQHSTNGKLRGAIVTVTYHCFALQLTSTDAAFPILYDSVDCPCTFLTPYSGRWYFAPAQGSSGVPHIPSSRGSRVAKDTVDH
ncbi:hypothetical protein NLU13_2336 [Sarocladium strictum]|uniref:HhH-GPD domain-containing protein n=1 Tax=Sarocladium strictum TaxID=5046 RepID=A0AA39GSN2_SARSR|nr:hypothetical protein NLU13_2336 [Sarocladium strictum]